MSETMSTRAPERDFDPAETAGRAPLLLPLMPPRTHATYIALALIWLASVTVFWVWWLNPEHNIDPFRFAVNCAILFWTTIVPGYFVAIVARARMPNPAIAVPPNLRVAMVVTKAPSEPFEVVKKTLQAMLRQPYPHDTWLADEDPSDATVAWCASHDVRISTRKGVTEYHNASWPRRTRCKEGNLAYFYDRYGYENYDFVSQLDADHVPTDTYLEEMLRPFADPKVGYVSAPSICDSNATHSWSARGRLYVEGPFHGTLQAGYNGGLAPTCIGSHYTVRTQALRDIGGLGPELAEDHSTTLIMNSNGWRGVHALNAIAHGEGPRTFTDLATQEFQWSKSLVVIMLRYTRHYFHTLPFHLKAQFLFCQLWYPFCSFSMAGALLLPVIALWTQRVWADVDYVVYFLFACAIMVSIFALMAWVKRTGSFRPYDARLASWEGVVFLFARWPWVLLGTLSAIIDCVRGREFSFRVTEKGTVTDNRVPLRVLLPYLAISLFSSIPLLAVDDAEDAGGFYIIAMLTAVSYLTVAIVIAVAHVRERGQDTLWLRILFGAPSLTHNVLFALAIGVAAAGIYLRTSPGLDALMWRAPAQVAPVAGKLLALGVYDPDRQFANNPNISIEHIFVSWIDPNTPRRIQQAQDYAKQRNRWLMVSVEPWSSGTHASGKLLAETVGGTYDTAIRETCTAMAKLDTPLFVRWGHEMEIPPGRYPWAANDPKHYIAAYRHFVDRCREASDKFLYVWSPAGDDSLRHYFPGRKYVDFVGLSLYECPNCGVVPAGGPGAEITDILREEYARVKRYHLPVLITELGVDGDAVYRREQLRKLQLALPEYPLLRAVFYFNAKDTPGAWPVSYVPDWRIDPAIFPQLVNTQ